MAYSPNLPFPTSLGGKKAIVAYSPNLPVPATWVRRAMSPTARMSLPASLGKKGHSVSPNVYSKVVEGSILESPQSVVFCDV